MAELAHALAAMGRSLADYAAVVGGAAVSQIVRARVLEHLGLPLARPRCRVARRLCPPTRPAPSRLTWSEFLDVILNEEVGA